MVGLCWCSVDVVVAEVFGLAGRYQHESKRVLLMREHPTLLQRIPQIRELLR